MKEHNLSRRKFIKRTAGLGLFLGGSGFAVSNSSLFKSINSEKTSSILNFLVESKLIQNAPVARYWTSTSSKNINCMNCHSIEEIGTQKSFKHNEEIIKCLLCAQGCIIKKGERGKCRARINVDGKLKSLVYGHPVAIHIDPIEKKPFYHFLPGSEAFSLATAGCPLSCKFCQNWEISQARPEDFSTDFVLPGLIAETSAEKNVPVIAFTYNEPTVFTEYLTDIARIAEKKDIRCVLVSCGFMNSDPLKEMCSVLSAIKIDLKGYSEDFYKNVCHAELKPVLRTIKQVSKSNVHLEIVNLVVPTLNDSDKMLSDLSGWIMSEIGPDVPIHFTRFHPDYKLLNLSPTPISVLERAREIAMDKGIHYAYVGNVPDHPGNNTYCPSCRKIVIKRTGFFIIEKHLNNGRCEYCNYRIAGVWE